jgi:predicted transcriptional regulator
MKNTTSQLTPLQLDVLQVLWERGEATVNDVTDALREPHGLALTTIATLLARLERRGVVKRRRVDRQFRYAALVKREEARRALVDELAKSLFDGDLGGLVHHLVARDEISAEDLARVRALLDRKSGDEKAGSASAADGEDR